MLEITLLRQQAAEVARKLAKKNLHDPEATVQNVLTLDESVRAAIKSLEAMRSDMNAAAKAIGAEMAKGNKDKAEALKKDTADLKQRIGELEAELQTREKALAAALVELPNTPHDSVPPGRTPQDNAVVYQNNRTVTLHAGKKPHWELAAQHKLIDFDLGSKITGAGFPVYTGKGARLQRALIQFFLDRATAAGYYEIQPPIVVNEASGFGTGQLPDKEGQMYYVGEDKLYLIPTAEVPITNLYRDVVLGTADLPVRNCGYTPCFRREAGSYGKDVRGLNRLHQFDKVEIVQITEPEKSYQALEDMRMYVAGLLDELELPYRTLLLCGGDMSFASAKTYDMEVYSAAQERWLEVSSVSNFETFQSNRLKLRYKTTDGKNALAHTLNGSALALPRIVAALLENNQQADGSITLPKVLHTYTGFSKIG
jgi:seryl-tRNA synthetase